MKLTILGCSGSLGAPGNPGSSYVISTPGNPDILMDFGPGALAAMQTREEMDPSNAHLIFSHLHADHCSDVPSLLVWRRYHPEKPAECAHKLYGPGHAATHFGRMAANTADEVDDISDTFDVHTWSPRTPVEIDGVQVTPFPVDHPAQESHALRVTCKKTGATLVYSGDSGVTPNLVEAARDADLFLCEAAWGPTSEGMAPGMHLSGEEAGRIAREAGVKKLVVVHIQPWADQQATLEAAAREFGGPTVLGEPGDCFEL